jgi:hypothetical protein
LLFQELFWSRPIKAWIDFEKGRNPWRTADQAAAEDASRNSVKKPRILFDLEKHHADR